MVVGFIGRRPSCTRFAQIMLLLILFSLRIQSEQQRKLLACSRYSIVARMSWRLGKVDGIELPLCAGRSLSVHPD